VDVQHRIIGGRNQLRLRATGNPRRIGQILGDSLAARDAGFGGKGR
jgi:hypothetical protein